MLALDTEYYSVGAFSKHTCSTSPLYLSQHLPLQVYRSLLNARLCRFAKTPSKFLLSAFRWVSDIPVVSIISCSSSSGVLIESLSRVPWVRLFGGTLTMFSLLDLSVLANTIETAAGKIDPGLESPFQPWSSVSDPAYPYINVGSSFQFSVYQSQKSNLSTNTVISCILWK